MNAIRKHFQGASWQRCQVHIARNALEKVGKRHRRAIADDARAVFDASSLEWAQELKAEVSIGWCNGRLTHMPLPRFEVLGVVTHTVHWCEVELLSCAEGRPPLRGARDAKGASGPHILDARP